LVLAPAVRRIDAGVLEVLELDAAGWFARQRTIWRLCVPSGLTAIGLVALVMIGSPVPLHLAQVDTYATRVWLALDRMPEAQQWAAWLAAWPLVLAAGIGGWFAARLMTDADTGSMPGPSVRERRWWRSSSVAAVVTWLLASVVPVLLFAFSVRHGSSYLGFLRVNGDAIARSLVVAGGVAVVMAVVCTLVWAAAAGGYGGRRAARYVVQLLALVGLAPGVLVGSWVAGGWMYCAPAIADSAFLVVLAHSTRFAFIAGLVGLRFADLEPSDRRDARRVDGGIGLVGWAHSVGWRAALPLLGVAVIGAVLSVNEIEASIMVVPPGFDTLARRLLDYLHFSRLEELSTASVLLGGGGILAGAMVAWTFRDDD
jgi:iron(III) transport system permease protein